VLSGWGNLSAYTRIEAGTASGREIGWISRKVSFHVAHSFRSEEAQFMYEDLSVEEGRFQCNIFLHNAGCGFVTWHNCKMA